MFSFEYYSRKCCQSARNFIKVTDMKKRFYPRLTIPKLRPLAEQLLGISPFNQAFSSAQPTHETPADFAKAVLKKLKIEYTLPPAALIEELREIQGPIMVVANHPLGGVEVLMMIHLLSLIRNDYRLMANQLLTDVQALKPAMLNIEEDDRPSSKLHTALQLVNYLSEGGMLGIFPSGEAADISLPGMRYTPQKWDDSIARLATLTQATVIPIYFHGQGNFVFQLMGMFSTRLRKNLLPFEFANTAESTVQYRIGKKILPSRIAQLNGDFAAINRYFQSKLYLLSLHFLPKSLIDWEQIQGWMPFGGQEAEAQPVIDAIDTEVLVKELEGLPKENLLVDTAQFCIYEMQQWQCPQLMQEIGRAREITFREVGEGSGKSCDVDSFDAYYYQLVLWDKEKKAVAGGYRIGKLQEILDTKGKDGIYIASIFTISEELLQKVQPTLELGRSFITKAYQRSYNPLLLLWTGICQFILKDIKYRYIIGPVSISAEMNSTSKTLLVNFLEENELAKDLTDYVKPKHKFKGKRRVNEFYHSFALTDIKDINEAITELEENQMGVPVLFKHYLKMGAKMLAFNIDPDFSDVLDCLMMTDLLKTDRHLLQKYMGKEGLARFVDYHEKGKE